MPKFIANSGKTLPRVKQTGKTVARVDPKTLGKILKAEMVPAKSVKSGSPVSMFALRQYLFENLHSSGGRPALETDTRRQKIPLSEEAWNAITALADALRAEGVTVSPGQMASAIVHQSLVQLNLIPIPKASRRKA